MTDKVRLRKQIQLGQRNDIHRYRISTPPSVIGMACAERLEKEMQAFSLAAKYAYIWLQKVGDLAL